MTIDEAIKLLNIAKEGFPVDDDEKYYVAMVLGVEALKRIKSAREIQCFASTYQLPGETED